MHGSISYVAPLAGAWIEILFLLLSCVNIMVAPLAGAWIEIHMETNCTKPCRVAPLAGAWIEINITAAQMKYDPVSLPLRERGLKYEGDTRQ